MLRHDELTRRELLKGVGGGLVLMPVAGLLGQGAPSASAAPQTSPEGFSDVWGQLNLLQRPAKQDKAVRIVGGPPELGGEPWPEKDHNWQITVSGRRAEDGRFGDLLLLPPYVDGEPQKLTDTRVNVKNFRRVRIVGLHLHITDRRFGRPRRNHPDGSHVWPIDASEHKGNDRILGFFCDDKPEIYSNADEIFMEGLHIEVDNHIAGQEVYAQGDGIAMFRVGGPDSVMPRIVLQNSRVATLGTYNADDQDGTGYTTAHPDTLQVQARVFARKLYIQNYYGASNYQVFFFPYTGGFMNNVAEDQRIDRTRILLRRAVLHTPSKQQPGRAFSIASPGGPPKPIWDCNPFIMEDDVYFVDPLGRREWRTVISPPVAYHNPRANAFEEPPRFVDGAPIVGTPKMRTSLSDAIDAAPASQVGIHYQSPWD